MHNESTPKTATRLTVNLSRKTVEALGVTVELTDNTKTEIINKAVQLYHEVQNAQHNGGGILIQSDQDREPILVRYF